MSTCKINLAKIKNRDNQPPYLRLLQSVIRNAENHRPFISYFEEILGISARRVCLRAWQGDILGDVRVYEDEIYDMKD